MTKNAASKCLPSLQYRSTSADIYAQEISVVAKTMSDITFRPILSSYDPRPWYEQDDVPPISTQEYATRLSEAWGTRVVFVPPPSPTHRDREKWLSSLWGCSDDSEESISEAAEHRGMEVVSEHHGMRVVPEVEADLVRAEHAGAEVVGAEVVGAEVVGAEVVGAEAAGAEVVGAEVVGAEHVGAGHRGIQVAVEGGLGDDLELIPIPSQALFFDLTPSEIQILG
jgi:hypothetical protein